jgi:hypothetical protein
LMFTAASVVVPDSVACLNFQNRRRTSGEPPEDNRFRGLQVPENEI